MLASSARLALIVSLGLAPLLPADAQDHTSDSLAIVAAGRAFSTAYVANDSITLGMLYSDSAMLLPPNRDVAGRSAIRRYFAWGERYRQISHRMEPQRITISGDMAADVGTWTSTGQVGDAAPRTSSGRYLIVWLREADGVWRILYDMWHRPPVQ